MLSAAKLLLATVVLHAISVVTNAGEISGTVQHRDGSKAKRVAVSGLTAGLLGGVTGKVYTDAQGRFRLTWSSKSDLAKVYVSGNVVATKIKNGSVVTLTIK